MLSRLKICGCVFNFPIYMPTESDADTIRIFLLWFFWGYFLAPKTDDNLGNGPHLSWLNSCKYFMGSLRKRLPERLFSTLERCMTPMTLAELTQKINSVSQWSICLQKRPRYDWSRHLMRGLPSLFRRVEKKKGLLGFSVWAARTCFVCSRPMCKEKKSKNGHNLPSHVFYRKLKTCLSLWYKLSIIQINSTKDFSTSPISILCPGCGFNKKKITPILGVSWSNLTSWFLQMGGSSTN